MIKKCPRPAKRKWGLNGSKETAGALPIGLAHGIVLKGPVAAGSVLTWADAAAKDDEAVRFRHEMEEMHGRKREEARK